MLVSRPATTEAPTVRGPVAFVSGVLQAVADRVVFLRLGRLIFVTYGVVAGAGALVSLIWISTLLIGLGVSKTELAAMIIGGAAAIVILSRLAVLVLDVKALIRDPVRTLRSAAFASWGGILALALTPIVFSWLTGHALLPLMDALALAAPVGHAIGRIGCLTYGCCHGRPTGLQFAIRYRDPGAKAVRASGLKDVPLHASPLYEAALVLVLVGLVNALALAGVPQGVPAASYLLLYGAGRLAIEFTRDNNGRRIAGVLAVNHLLALAMSVSGGLLLLGVLQDRATMPAIDYGSGLAGTLEMLPLLVAGSLIVLIGFSLQRDRIGEW